MLRKMSATVAYGKLSGGFFYLMGRSTPDSSQSDYLGYRRYARSRSIDSTRYAVVWFLTSIASRLVSGRSADLFGLVAATALAVWAVWEVVSGVNPFRRLLGGAVLVWVIYTRLGGG